MLKNIKIFILLILLPSVASATSIGIGTNAFYSKINDPDLRFAKEYENIQDPINAIRNVNISLTNNYGRLIYSVATNRLLNNGNNRVVLDNYNREYNYRSQVILDSASLGYAITKDTAISVFVGNLLLKQKLERANYYKKSQETAILYGVSIGKKINNQAVNLILLAPSQAIKAEYGIGLSYSYQIKLF